jgi:ATP-dependent DNA helicase RecG
MSRIYSQSDLIAKLDTLRNLPAENELVEFKEAKNGYDFDKIGKYFSALSNEANLKEKPEAWLIFGVEDKKHIIVGSRFRSQNRASLDSLKKEIADKISPTTTFIEIYELDLPEGRVVMLQIPAAPKGLPIAWEGHYYGRVNESHGALGSEKYERIRGQAISHDWSAGICEGATLNDLDSEAIRFAREKYAQKNPRLKSEIESWNDATFLNKARVTLNGKITRTAILLLGKSESEHFLQPGIAQITWILKDRDNIEKDYEHFTCPFILATSNVFARIRNLKYRYIKDQTLFPDEVEQYEPFNIREALHNCIAHQDYTKGGRISVVENEDARLIFTNLGEFLPKSIEAVLKNDAPPSYYRNKFLAEAMRNLDMVDTIGSGIRRMFRNQQNRFFPMPEYDFQRGEVKTTLIGKILDMEYARTLARVPNLSLEEIFLLDKVQKKKALTFEEVRILRQKKLIEGQRPNYFISAKVAQATGQKAAYTKNKAFEKQEYIDWIIKCLKTHKELTRKDIDELLMGRLSENLSQEQKKRKIGNLLSELRIKQTIENKGTDSQPRWVLKEEKIA